MIMLAAVALAVGLGLHAQEGGLHFPANPYEGQRWMYVYYYTHGSWQYRPSSPSVYPYPLCGPGSHLHPRGMPTSQPDVKNGPLPKADNLCHRDDQTDAAVYPHGSKKPAASQEATR